MFFKILTFQSLCKVQVFFKFFFEKFLEDENIFKSQVSGD